MSRWIPNLYSWVGSQELLLAWLHFEATLLTMWHAQSLLGMSLISTLSIRIGTTLHEFTDTKGFLIKKYPLCVSSLIMILSPYISPNARWLFWVTKCKVIILRFILKLHQNDVHNLKGANTDREGGKTSRCIVFDTRKWWLLLCTLTYATLIYIKTFANECVYL